MTRCKMDEKNFASIMFCFQIAIYLRALMAVLLKHHHTGQVSSCVNKCVIDDPVQVVPCSLK